MENAKKILACVDQSRFAHGVAGYAAWAARRVQAPLEFLHVLDRHPERGQGDDHSGAIGIDAQETLIGKLAAEEAARTAAAREEGRAFLSGMRERALDAGADSVDVRQRHGTLDDALADQCQQVRLLVLGHGGNGAGSARHALGDQVESVVRALHVPVLIVPDAFSEPKRILIAFDGGIAARRAVEMVATSPLFDGMEVQLLMAGKESHDSASALAWAEGVVRAAGRDVLVMLEPGDVAEKVVAALEVHSIDLLVMGAFGHSALRSLIFGSRTAELLRAVSLPTLLLR